jgi:hypothetical protein
MLNAKVETVHEDRMQRDNVVGAFCGQPIITVDELGASADDLADLYTRLATSSHTSIPAEILPGEERCADGIIRRITTAEAQGYDNYHNKEQIEAGLQRGGIDLGRKASLAGELVYWRPNRATLEVYRAGTELPCLANEPEPFVLIAGGENA